MTFYVQFLCSLFLSDKKNLYIIFFWCNYLQWLIPVSPCEWCIIRFSTRTCCKRFVKQQLRTVNTLISGNLEEEKVLELRQNLFFLFCKSLLLITLKLFWFTIASSIPLNKGVQFFFHDICHFFVCIADCIKLYKRII